MEVKGGIAHISTGGVEVVVGVEVEGGITYTTHTFERQWTSRL